MIANPAHNKFIHLEKSHVSCVCVFHVKCLFFLVSPHYSRMIAAEKKNETQFQQIPTHQARSKTPQKQTTTDIFIFINKKYWFACTLCECVSGDMST